MSIYRKKTSTPSDTFLGSVSLVEGIILKISAKFQGHSPSSHKTLRTSAASRCPQAVGGPWLCFCLGGDDSKILGAKAEGNMRLNNHNNLKLKVVFKSKNWRVG